MSERALTPSPDPDPPTGPAPPGSASPAVATRVADTAAGDHVTYDLYGSPGAVPRVVFVHAAGQYRGNSAVTGETARLLAASGVPAVVYDRLGRGDSPAAGRLDLDRELAAVAAAIDVVGGSATLVGHSSGCAIALRAADVGLAIDAMALWEAPLDATPGAAELVDVWAAEIESLLDADDLEGAIEHFMADMPPEWLAGLRASPDWPAFVAMAPSQRVDAQALAWAQRALEDGALSGVTAPVLALAGERTIPGMPEAAEAIAAAVPDGRAERVAGSDHGWVPGPMADRLVRFLSD